MFYGEALDQELSYPVQETCSDGGQRERCSCHGDVPKGAMGFVQCETHSEGRSKSEAGAGGKL